MDLLIYGVFDTTKNAESEVGVREEVVNLLMGQLVVLRC